MFRVHVDSAKIHFSNSVFFQLPGWVLVSGVVDCFQNTADVQKEAMLWPKMQKPPHGRSRIHAWADTPSGVKESHCTGQGGVRKGKQTGTGSQHSCRNEAWSPLLQRASHSKYSATPCFSNSLDGFWSVVSWTVSRTPPTCKRRPCCGLKCKNRPTAAAGSMLGQTHPQVLKKATDHSQSQDSL